VAIFACSGEGVWEVVELPVAVETRLVIDRTPLIHPLAYVEDVYDRYALCLADSQTARVYVVTLGRAEREETVKGPTINYKMTGGWSQKRIQERIKNAVSEHIREVAARLEQIVFTENLPWIILAGDEIVQTEFKRHLSERAWERVVEQNRLDTKLPAHEAIARSLETIREAEGAEARDMARQALDATLADGLGAAGVEAVVQALRQGAVDTLILDREFSATGWRCVEDPSVAGDGGVPSECPVGPGPAEPADLREELVSQALQTGAEVEFVEGSEELARMGGVAALLRWRPSDLPNRVADKERE
jgi:peptide subunit release factor 1 (eRF1)